MLGVQVAVAHDELVVVSVQVATQQGVLLVVLRFVSVKPLVGVAQVDIKLRFLRLHPVHVERLEGRPVPGDILQHPDLEADSARMFPDERAVFQVRLHDALEGAWFHGFLLPVLPFLRCQGGFLLVHLPFHTLYLFFRPHFVCVLYRIDSLYLFHLLGGIGIHLLLSQTAQFGTPFGSERHHHFVEAVDGRIGFPVQTSVNGILRVIVYGRLLYGRFGLRLLLFLRLHLYLFQFRRGKQRLFLLLLAFGLAAFLSLRFQPAFRHPPLFLRVAKQVVQVHNRGFGTFGFHPLRHGLHRIFFSFHFRLHGLYLHL